MPSSKRLKQVIVMRKALGMSPGKMIAQAGHAVSESPNPGERIKRIALWADDASSLHALMAKCVEKGLPYSPVIDSGKTEVEPGSFTCMAIGPAQECDIDEVTGRLDLI